jgi:hypothetical protein
MIIRFLYIIVVVWLFLINISYSREMLIESYKDVCRADLEFFRNSLKEDSAIYANELDKKFKKWYKEGHENTLKLVELIGDKDDCYYAIKYYVNGFEQSHISMRAYGLLPAENYPGLLTVASSDNKHYIFYKDSSLKYLKNIKIGDELTHINGIQISEYYNDYLKPFYANDKSILTQRSASLYALILDGNRFKPIPQNITLKRGEKIINLDLKYKELSGEGLVAAKETKQPENTEGLKVEMISNGVWIKIPSFFPNSAESVYFTGMLSTLKNKLAKEDYIVFDMRGNRGGASKWSRPILRNLWGDDKIKSLGKEHIYNTDWEKKLRISKENFAQFKSSFDASAANFYMKNLRQGKKFFLKKWSIFQDKENLHTNSDSSNFNAKIYVLTDNFCRSTCWMFVREMLQMPNVKHIGQETTIQSIYSYAKKIKSPSEYFDFFLPTQIMINPSYKLGKALIPSIKYEGDIRNDVKVKEWVLSIIEEDLAK